MAAVRDGDTEAFGTLFERHVDAVRKYARARFRPSDADDLVSYAFHATLAALRKGLGPESAFRAYVLTSVRHQALSQKLRYNDRITLSDDMTRYDMAEEPVDTEFGRREHALLARALALGTLSERVRLILANFGLPAAELARLIEAPSANAANVARHRAMEELRAAYLQAQIPHEPDESCRDTVEQLGAWVRGPLRKRAESRVNAHLQGCSSCRATLQLLIALNPGLAVRTRIPVVARGDGRTGGPAGKPAPTDREGAQPNDATTPRRKQGGARRQRRGAAPRGEESFAPFGGVPNDRAPAVLPGQLDNPWLVFADDPRGGDNVSAVRPWSEDRPSVRQPVGRVEDPLSPAWLRDIHAAITAEQLDADGPLHAHLGRILTHLDRLMPGAAPITTTQRTELETFARAVGRWLDIAHTELDDDLSAGQVAHGVTARRSHLAEATDRYRVATEVLASHASKIDTAPANTSPWARGSASLDGVDITELAQTIEGLAAESARLESDSTRAAEVQQIRHAWTAAYELWNLAQDPRSVPATPRVEALVSYADAARHWLMALLDRDNAADLLAREQGIARTVDNYRQADRRVRELLPTLEAQPVAAPGTEKPGPGEPAPIAPPEAQSPVASAPADGREPWLDLPPPEPHKEVNLGHAAGVTDVGRRTANQDDFAIATAVINGERVTLAAVCDGTSGEATRSDRAAAVGSAAACAVLEHEAAAVVAGRTWDPAAVLAKATQAAQTAVLDLISREFPGCDLPPVSTIVLSLVTSTHVFTECAGDSRAYWVPLDGGPAVQLTTDDSALQSYMDVMGLSAEQAARMPHASSLTRGLGVKYEWREPDPTAHRIAGRGVVALVSDGPIKKIGTPDAIADQVRAQLARTSGNLLAAAQAFATAAVDAGTRDNVTVVLIAGPDHSGRGKTPPGAVGTSPWTTPARQEVPAPVDPRTLPWTGGLPQGRAHTTRPAESWIGKVSGNRSAAEIVPTVNPNDHHEPDARRDPHRKSDPPRPSAADPSSGTTRAENPALHEAAEAPGRRDDEGVIGSAPRSEETSSDVPTPLPRSLVVGSAARLYAVAAAEPPGETPGYGAVLDTTADPAWIEAHDGSNRISPSITGFHDLPDDVLSEYLRLAEIAVPIVVAALASGTDVSADDFLDDLAGRIHNGRLQRHWRTATPEQRLPFDDPGYPEELREQHRRLARAARDSVVAADAVDRAVADPFRSCTTGAAVAAEMWRRHAVRMFGFDVPGITVELVRELARAIHQLLTKYPHIQLLRIGFGPISESRLLAESDHVAGTDTRYPYTRSITVSDAVAADRELFASEWADMVNSGRAVGSVAEPVVGLIRREFGYSLNVATRLIAQRKAKTTLIDHHENNHRGPMRWSPREAFAWSNSQFREYGPDGKGRLNSAAALAGAFAAMEHDPRDTSDGERVLHNLLIEIAPQLEAGKARDREQLTAEYRPVTPTEQQAKLTMAAALRADYGIDIIGLDNPGIPAATAGELIAAVRHMIARFPILLGDLSEIRIAPGDAGEFARTSFDGIEFNELWMTAPARMHAEAVEQLAAERLRIDLDRVYFCLAIHELAHLLRRLLPVHAPSAYEVVTRAFEERYGSNDLPALRAWMVAQFSSYSIRQDGALQPDEAEAESVVAAEVDSLTPTEGEAIVHRNFSELAAAEAERRGLPSAEPTIGSRPSSATAYAPQPDRLAAELLGLGPSFDYVEDLLRIAARERPDPAWIDSPDYWDWQLNWLAERGPRLSVLAAFSAATLEAEAALGLPNTSGRRLLLEQSRPRTPGELLLLYKYGTMWGGEPEQPSGPDTAARASAIGRVQRDLSFDELPQYAYLATIAARPILQADRDLTRKHVRPEEFRHFDPIPRDGVYGLNYPGCRALDRQSPAYFRARYAGDSLLPMIACRPVYDRFLNHWIEPYQLRHAMRLRDGFDGTRSAEGRIAQWFTSIVADVLAASPDAAPEILDDALRTQLRRNRPSTPANHRLLLFAETTQDLLGGDYDFGHYLRRRDHPETEGYIRTVRETVLRRHPTAAVARVPFLANIIDVSGTGTALNGPNGSPGPAAPTGERRGPVTLFAPEFDPTILDRPVRGPDRRPIEHVPVEPMWAMGFHHRPDGQPWEVADNAREQPATTPTTHSSPTPAEDGTTLIGAVPKFPGRPSDDAVELLERILDAEHAGDPSAPELRAEAIRLIPDEAERAYAERHAGNARRAAALAAELGITPERLDALTAEELKRAFAGEIVHRTKAATLLKILRDGRFKTIFETGGRSVFAQVPLEARRELEQVLFGYRPDLPVELRPIHSRIRRTWRAWIHEADFAPVQDFGDVDIVLRSAVRERTTGCIGSPVHTQVIPSALSDPRPESFGATPTEHGEFGYFGLEGIGRDYDGDRFHRNVLIQAQTHGGVQASDIAYVVFHGERPGRELREAMAAAGIPWISSIDSPGPTPPALAATVLPGDHIADDH
ncbi:zf-HC2 domain-containing protein [Nocardia africana]